MFDKFTDGSRKVMQNARQEARRLGHDYIGSEHILLGFIQDDSGVGTSILKKRNIDLKQIKLCVEKSAPASTASSFGGTLPFTVDTKKIIELAFEESQELESPEIETEHLLLGILRENESIAAHVLQSFGLNFADIKNQVIALREYEKSSTDVFADNKTINLYDFRERTLTGEELVYVAGNNWINASERVHTIMSHLHSSVSKFSHYTGLIPNISDKHKLLKSLEIPPEYGPEPVLTLPSILFEIAGIQIRLNSDEIFADSNPQEANSDLIQLYLFREQPVNSGLERDVFVWGINWEDALRRSYKITEIQKGLRGDRFYRLVPVIEKGLEVAIADSVATIPKSMLTYNSDKGEAKLTLDRRIL